MHAVLMVESRDQVLELPAELLRERLGVLSGEYQWGSLLNVQRDSVNLLRQVVSRTVVVQL